MASFPIFVDLVDADGVALSGPAHTFDAVNVRPTGEVTVLSGQTIADNPVPYEGTKGRSDVRIDVYYIADLKNPVAEHVYSSRVFSSAEVEAPGGATLQVRLPYAVKSMVVRVQDALDAEGLSAGDVSATQATVLARYMGDSAAEVHSAIASIRVAQELSGGSATEDEREAIWSFRQAGGPPNSLVGRPDLAVRYLPTSLRDAALTEHRTALEEGGSVLHHHLYGTHEYPWEKRPYPTSEPGMLLPILVPQEAIVEAAGDLTGQGSHAAEGDFEAYFAGVLNDTVGGGASLATKHAVPSTSDDSVAAQRLYLRAILFRLVGPTTAVRALEGWPSGDADISGDVVPFAAKPGLCTGVDSATTVEGVVAEVERLLDLFDVSDGNTRSTGSTEDFVAAAASTLFPDLLQQDAEAALREIWEDAFPDAAIRYRQQQLFGTQIDAALMLGGFNPRSSSVTLPAGVSVEDVETVKRLSALVESPGRVDHILAVRDAVWPEGSQATPFVGARSIVAVGRDDFLRAMSLEGSLDEETARAIYTRAVIRHAASLHTVSSLRTKNPPTVPDGAAAVRGDAAVQDIVGTLDACECTHCSSVLSPAAYLVDMLDWLADIPADPANPPPGMPIDTAQDEFLRRRPDVKSLPLTCDNTHTAESALVLALKVLRNTVAIADDPGVVLDGPTFDADLNALLADSGTLVEPAWHLPFHVDSERSERLADQVGFQPYAAALTVGASSPVQAGVFQSQQHFDLLTDPVPTGTSHTVWGSTDPDYVVSSQDAAGSEPLVGLDRLSRLDNFLDKTELDFDAVQDLVATWPALSLENITSVAQACSRQQKVVMGLDDTTAGRLYAALRLTRQLDTDFWGLLPLMAAEGFTKAAMTSAMEAVLISNELGLSLLQVAPWFGVLDTRGRPSDSSWISLPHQWFPAVFDGGVLRSVSLAEAAALLAPSSDLEEAEVMAVLTERGASAASTALTDEAMVRLASLRVVAEAADWGLSDVVGAWLAVDDPELGLPAPFVLDGVGCAQFVRRLRALDSSAWNRRDIVNLLRGELLPADTDEETAKVRVQGIEALSAEAFDLLTSAPVAPVLPDWVAGCSFETFANWRALVDLVSEVGPQGDPSALVGHMVSETLPTAADVAASLGWLLSDVTGPAGIVPVSVDSASRSEHWLQLAKLRRIAPPAVVLSWATDPAQAASGLEEAVQRLFSSDKASELIAQAETAGAPAQRAALVEWLARHTDVEGEGKLLQGVLSDVYTGTCTQTTAVLEAITAVQLFVHHTMRGLESEYIPAVTAKQRSTWRWMKNYRMWEVSRKLYLWPDNWLLPELRANKSHLFQELESVLASDDLSDGVLHDAILDYAQGLDQLSSLQVDAVCVGHQANLETTHLFGRTRTTPRKTFYRSWQNRTTWSPWEAMPFDIDVPHLIPLFDKGRLFLFWPQFVEMTSDDVQFWNIHFMRSEKRRDGWTAPVKLEGEFSLQETPAGSQPPENFFFSASVNDEGQTEITAYCQVAGVSLMQVQVQSELSHAMRQVQFAQQMVDMGMLVLESALSEWNARVTELQADLEQLPLDTSGRARVGTLTLSACSGATSGGTNWEAVDLNTPAFALNGAQRWHIRPAFDVPGPGTKQTLAERVASTPIRKLEPTPTLDDYGHVAIPATLLGEHLAVELAPDEFVDELVLGSSPRRTEVVWSHASPNFSGDTPFVVQDASGLSILGRRVARATRSRTVPMKSPVTSTVVATLNRDTLDTTRFTESVYSPPANTYAFDYLSHPFSCEIVETISDFGPFGVLDPVAVGSDVAWETQSQERVGHFTDTYSPDAQRVPSVPSAVVDFSAHASMALYNYELFLYAPMLVAMTLSRRGEYERATDWFHSLYDPRRVTSDGEAETTFKVKPLSGATALSIANRLRALLGAPVLDANGDVAEGDLALAVSEAEISRFEAELIAWANNPFDPHAVAQTRPDALQRAVVLRYLEHLLEWADSLFRADTREDLAQALPLYLTVKDLLGERPLVLPAADTDGAGVSFGELLSQPGERLDRVEAVLPRGVGAGRASRLDEVVEQLPLSLASDAFCIPRNDRWDVLWDRVDDRLFKLRNCMNIDGVVRQLPFFEPPLDPFDVLQQLNRAGDDLGFSSSAGSDLRFAVLLGRARQAAELARSFAGSLQSALVSADGEALQQMRAEHQSVVTEMNRLSRRLASDEARYSLTASRAALRSAEQRLGHYERLVEVGELPDELSAYRLSKQASVLQAVSSSIVAGSSLLDALGTIKLGITPHVDFGAAYVGLAVRTQQQAVAGIAAERRDRSSRKNTEASWKRRRQDWDLQLKSAARDVEQTSVQVQSAELRVQMADNEYDIYLRQRQHQREEESFLATKFTSGELYNWMKNESLALLKGTMETATQWANAAAAAAWVETGSAGLADDWSGTALWTSSKQGLMAPERLLQRLTALELKYAEANKRRPELTKHVSLAMLDAEALMELRTVGSCTFSIPKGLTDLDFPRHGRRRIRTLAVTMPSTTGRYGAATATLELLSADPDVPSRTVVDLSSSQSDGGVFRLSMDDQRYLPFEYHFFDEERAKGADPSLDTYAPKSRWQLTLSGAGRQWRTFDWSTIADVVLTVQYEVTEVYELDENGGVVPAMTSVPDSISEWLEGSEMGLIRSVRHDAPDAWHQLLQAQEAFENQYAIRWKGLGDERSAFEVEDDSVGAYQPTHDWTIAFWHYSPRDMLCGLVSKYDQANDKGLLMSRSAPSGGPHLIHFRWSWAAGHYALSWTAPPSGEWHHIALVNHANSGNDATTIELYIDGVLQVPVSAYVGSSPFTPVDYLGQPFAVGGHPDAPNTTSGRDTWLDELALYNNRALTPEELAWMVGDTTPAVYPLATPVPSPDHWWRFGDAPGDLAPGEEGGGTSVRPTVFHDMVGAADLVLRDGMDGLAHNIEVLSQPLGTRSHWGTVVFSNDDLPFAVRHMVRAGHANLVVEGVDMWLLYEESLETIPSNEPSLVEWGLEGGKEDISTGAGSTIEGQARKLEMNFASAKSSMQPISFTFNVVPPGLKDIALHVRWKLDFTVGG